MTYYEKNNMLNKVEYMNIAIINFTTNMDLEKDLKEHYFDQKIILYTSIKNYNKHIDSFYKDDYNEFFFDNYKNNFEILFIIIDQSKRKIRKEISKNRFIPIKIVTLDQKSNINEQLKSKVQPLQSNWFFSNFTEKYRELLGNRNINYDNFIEYVIKCPFCRNKKFIFDYEYNKYIMISCSINIKCSSCHKIIIEKDIFAILDAIYVYNPKVEAYLKEYVKNYPMKESIIMKIRKEQDRVKLINPSLLNA